MGAEKYERQGDFSDDEAAAKGGRAEQDSSQLDAELDRVLVVVNLHADDLDILLRDDGLMTEDILQGHEFSGTSITVLKGLVGNQNAALTWRGDWVTLTAYEIGDLVHEDGNAYFCLVAHTSGTFATDLTAVKWDLFVAQGSAVGFPAGQAANLVLVATSGSAEAWQTITALHAPLHALIANTTLTGTLTAAIANFSGLLTANAGIALAAKQFNPGLTTKSAASVDPDPVFSFNGGIIQSIDTDAAITSMATSNRVAGNLTEVRFEPDTVNRAIAVNANWTWLGSEPTQILANKTAVMALRCYGTAETDVIAVWNEEV